MRSPLLRLGWLPFTSLVVLAACTSEGPTGPAATQLTFSVQPSNATGGVAISPAVVVAIEDASGNVVTSASSVVTVTIATNPGGGTLAGTPNVAAVNGVAIFSNLHIDKAGAGYTLTASASGLTGTTSAPFDITPAATRSPIIAFHSNHGIEEIGADGLGRAVLIADSTAFQPAWSPDGARLAFTRTADRWNTCEIYTVRADGSNERKITTPLTQPWCANSPAWSPDGYKIAFAGGPAGNCGDAPACFGQNIYVVNADGSNARELFDFHSLPPITEYPNLRYVLLAAPTWSPDGTKLVFECYAYAVSPGPDYFDFLCAGDAAGSSARRLLGFGGGAGEELPAWSPDGSQIAIGGGSITLLNVDGSTAADLTPYDAGDLDPTWSPDGAHVVFTRAAGSPDLFIINRDGTGLRRLTTTGDASHPTWRSATPLPLPQP